MTCEAIDHFVAIMTVALTGGFFTACWLTLRKIAHAVVDDIRNEMMKCLGTLDKDDAAKVAEYLLKEAWKNTRRK